MAQRGYLGDGYGMRGDHGDDEFFDRDDRDFRSRKRNFSDRDREFGDRSRHSGDRDRNFMFDRGAQQPRSRNDWNEGRRELEGWGGGNHRDHDRGFLDRARETARDWFGDDDNSRRERQQDRDWNSQDRNEMRPTFGGFGNQTGWESAQRSRPGAHRDDHYRSWRERQMQALDRDYEDYCRENEQKFHQDFDSWRQNRQQGRQAGETGTDQQVAMGSDRPSLDSPRPGTDPQGSGLNQDRSTEVGAGSMPGQGATSVGAGSELAGATGTFVNEGTGGNSGGRKKSV